MEARPGRWPVAGLDAFLFGIALSLCANIASAPELSAPGVAVAASPPLAMLLAVELLNRALKRHRAETARAETAPLAAETGVATIETGAAVIETPGETDHRSGETAPRTPTTSRLVLMPRPAARVTPTAEDRMWAYYQAQRAQGRTPTGAELDRLANTNNYGSRVLRRWHGEGGRLRQAA